MRLVAGHRAIIGNTVSGTVSTGYINSWLTTQDVGKPGRTDGAMSLGVAGVGSIDFLAIANHNVVNGASISTGVGTIPTTAWRGDGIPYNFGLLLAAPTTPGSLTLAISGNPSFTAVGMFYAGLSYNWPDFLSGRRLTPQQPFPWEGEFSSLAPYDPGLAAQRRVAGTVILTDAQHEELLLACESQRMGNYPLLWLDNDLVNDPWLCQIFIDSEHKEKHHFVNLQIAEVPRLRW